MIMLNTISFPLQAAQPGSSIWDSPSIILLVAIVLLIFGVFAVAKYRKRKVYENSVHITSEPYYAPNDSATGIHVATPKTKVERLKEIHSLLQQGLINEADFEEQKKKILDSE